MLPLTLLQTAQNHQMLVELRNGETYNGILMSCDSWMNIKLKEVICTSRDGDKFWKMTECYIRGTIIKYMRIPDEVIDLVKEDIMAKKAERREANQASFRGGRGGGSSDRGSDRGGSDRGGGDRGRGGGRGGRGGSGRGGYNNNNSYGDRGGRGGFKRGKFES